MLRAMKEQLKYLAKHEDKNFHDTLRNVVGKKATETLEAKLKQVIVLMPDLIAKMHQYWQAEKTHSQTKRLGSYLLTYMYLPNNFISQKEWGLFGYLDDAYFVSKMFTTMIEDLQVTGGHVRPDDIALYQEVKSLKQSVRIVIPKECGKIDTMIEELLQDKKDSFFSLVSQNK